MHETKYQLVLVTTPDVKTAQAIATGLLEQRLAACVSISAAISSMYWWENGIKTGEERQLFIKTRASLAPDVMHFVREQHPYKVPEIITLDIVDGNPSYLDWLGANCTFTASSPQDRPTLAPRPLPPQEEK